MCAVSRLIPSCYVMYFTSERCVLWEDQSHQAVQCAWLLTHVCSEQMSPIMQCNMFDCREMCPMSRWVPSCYVMCFAVRRDVCSEKMSRIMLCNVCDYRDICAVSRWVPSCYVTCLTVQRDVCCEQMSHIMLCNVFGERCVLWEDQSHHAV